ncbi:type II glyceraldehyde-3-phosphate dehydrogenase [Halostella sp. JP-L12]|uniref:type II glyceraldehyde-3-phosphate dehydrogenase n=1 Tax=Halostella TaxID=1843185 RepID=UPI000EF83D14|nr:MULTISPECIES: type II glyceraldehyde-3-phosphate dehydrogenase [Halostella]NHN48265.1 type II glyceraldehyde-3-phosphate dehydrogenase [Halostella sp. JP-L12]
MLQVGVNGYGTIGKRVADAVRAQPDMEIRGVAKTSPDHVAESANRHGYPLYVAGADGTGEFKSAGLDVAGTVDELVAESDVVVDATPGGIGAENKPLYEDHDTPALFQGAESPDVADVSFNARANYSEALGEEYVRVVSCNTTGLSRLLAPLYETYGVEHVNATLVRRGGDPDQSCRGPINDTLPDPVSLPSHHGPDVQTVFPDLSIHTAGLKVPTTLMHVHSLSITLDAEPSEAEVRDLFADEDRLFLVPEGMGIDGAGALKEFARDAGRPRGDVWENCVWEESITTDGTELHLFQAIHQESDVVPENVDALRAVAELADAEESIERTNETLGVGI